MIHTYKLTCGREIKFRYLKNVKLKNIYISIGPENIVALKAPLVSMETLHTVIEKKAEWIFNKISQQKNSFNIVLENNHPAQIFGNTYKVDIVKSALNPVGTAEIYLCEDKLKVLINPYLFKQEYFLKSLDKFLVQKATELITPIIEERSVQMGLVYKKLSFRSTKTRWGSCSSNGNISINYNLVRLPKECVDYVCVHELAHLKYLNHGHNFWSLVRYFVPEYEKIRKFMKSCTIT